MLKYEIVVVTQFEQNCSVLWCDETLSAAVVDPGGDLDRIYAVVEKHHLILEKILLTHAHIDHAGAVSELSREKNLPIIGPHKEDQFWIDMLPMQSQMFGLPHAESFTPDSWLDQGDTVAIGNIVLGVRVCPGHTPGHVVFYHPQSKLLVVGDVLFKGSIGRTDFPKGDHQTWIDSIRRELFCLDDDVKFIPGHGAMSTIGHEKKTNPFVSDSHSQSIAR